MVWFNLVHNSMIWFNLFIWYSQGVLTLYALHDEKDII